MEEIKTGLIADNPVKPKRSAWGHYLLSSLRIAKVVIYLRYSKLSKNFYSNGVFVSCLPFENTAHLLLFGFSTPIVKSLTAPNRL